MVKGRLPRESNPLPGDKSGFVASHDTTGEEDYERTSPLNPFPVKSIGDSNVKDAAVKAELELIKQGIADNKATNDLILARLDNPINTQVTGSKREHRIILETKFDYTVFQATYGTRLLKNDGTLASYGSSLVEEDSFDISKYHNINLFIKNNTDQMISLDGSNSRGVTFSNTVNDIRAGNIDEYGKNIELEQVPAGASLSVDSDDFNIFYNYYKFLTIIMSSSMNSISEGNVHFILGGEYIG